MTTAGSFAWYRESTPEALATGILQILSDSSLGKRMGQAGIEFMTGRPLQQGFDQFLEAVNRLLKGESFEELTLQPLYQLPPIIPKTHLNSHFAVAEGSIQTAIDPGRLAFLPLSMRRVLRRCYWAMRRLID